jgi:hypothetical protein
MFRSRLAVLLVGASLLAFGPAALGASQQPTARAVALARLGERVVGSNSQVTTVMGFAWSASNDPLANIGVQLRNLLTGAVEARSRTNGAGEFLFSDVGGGTYVVELVNDSGNVVALGAPFTVAPGGTVATFVRLAQPAPWFTTALSNTAAAAVFAAAGLGIAALEPPAQSASADR